LVILLADLDGFKIINDTYGHLTGNSVLKTVASTLLRQCSEGDMVARMGGDEFVIVCPYLHPPMAGDFCLRLKTAIEKAGMAELGRPLLSASIGIGVYPEDGMEPDQLLAVADRQMYENKELARQQHTGIWALSEAVSIASEQIPEDQPCAAPGNS
jgi:diguanylate cyclase (GGDEF)-like protein